MGGASSTAKGGGGRRLQEEEEAAWNHIHSHDKKFSVNSCSLSLLYFIPLTNPLPVPLSGCSVSPSGGVPARGCGC